MIWGETKHERVRLKRQRDQRYLEDHTGPVFIWFPRKLECGRWAWLETVHRHAWQGMIWGGFYFDYSALE